MDRRIRAILVLLDQESFNVVTIESLAESVGLSVSRFRHLFKLETGKSVNRYLREIRLRRAEHLLRTSYLSIKQIAEEVGHISAHYLAREFRKVYGLAPTAYRRRFGTHSKRHSKS